MYEFLVSFGITWQDLVRLAAAWAIAAGLVLFWYWVMTRIGTF